MFEAAELGQSVSKEDFKRQEGPMREALLEVQQAVLEAKLPVILVIGGVDGGGKGEAVNTLMEWFDPRGVRVNALHEPTDEERARPWMWRFWRRLPPRGRIGLFLGSWYTDPIVDRVKRRIKKRELDVRVDEILAFERMLALDGAVILKFWLHLSKKAQKKRFEKLESDPLTKWRVTPADWENFEQYDRYYELDEKVLRKTSTGEAPWFVIESADPYYRDLAISRTIRDQLQEKLRLAAAAPPRVRPHVPLLAPGERSVLAALEHGAPVDDDSYDRELARLQGRLHQLARKASRAGRSAVVVFEGADAAGKGGAIRRLTAAMDARDYEVIPVAAPTESERQHHYLWRFWQHVPSARRVTIFDRSWYGRVLVEPAEGFCTEQEWDRAYAEINDFEEQLTRAGTIVIKFWLDITKEEQLARFKAREEIGFKRFKIGPEDYRNREKWELYEALVHRMVAQTSTELAPWTLIPANDKKHARLVTLRTVCARVESEL
jgi:polyphosphate:AMP phosphotransferase